MMLGPPSSGRCCDALARLQRHDANAVFCSNKEQLAIHFEETGVSIIRCRRAKASQHRPDEGGPSITMGGVLTKNRQNPIIDYR
jgi:hypothetical protein